MRQPVFACLFFLTYIRRNDYVDEENDGITSGLERPKNVTPYVVFIPGL